VYAITSTREPLADDIARRARRYMFQMSLRTVCFLGAAFTWGRVPTPVSVALLIGAVVLPYVAVVLANAGRERPEQADPFTEITRQLGSGPDASAGTGNAPRQHDWQHDRQHDPSRRAGTRPLWDHDGPVWEHGGRVDDGTPSPDGQHRG
jgi:hypothetical protein